MVLRFKKLMDTAATPTFGTADSAGMDIRAAEDTVVRPGETVLVRTGLAFEIPEGFVGLFFPRSGLSLRTSLRQPNSVGVIDADYRGEVRGMFENTGDEEIVISRGDRFGQMVVVPYIMPVLMECGELSETDRGEGGFGSTGVK